MEAVHPADRQLVDTWADEIEGPVIDAGCGPGHWTNYLAERGVAVRGIDFVPEFVAHAGSSCVRLTAAERFSSTPIWWVHGRLRRAAR